MRFKRGTQKTSGDGDWVEVVGKRNLYATKGDGTLRDGCIEDFQRAENTPNICTFYHNGDVVARGAAEHPLIGYKDADTRFVATRQIETDRELTPAEGWLVAKGGVRLIDGVTHGVCHIKDKNTYRFFYNGSEVGEIPVGSDANAYVTIPGGSKTFLLNGNQAKFVGVNNDVPCYAISIFQNGVWSITKEEKSNAPETWSIDAQHKIAGAPRYYEIVRTEVLEEVPQTPYAILNVPIRSLAEKDEEDQNLSALATVWYWHDGTPEKGPGKVRWEITKVMTT